MSGFSDGDKILAFSTRRNLDVSASDVLYGDGPFFVATKLFVQLSTIHAKISDHVSFGVLLLPNKKRETYTRAFRLIKETAGNCGLQLNPDKIQVEEVWLDVLADMPQDERMNAVADYVTSWWVEGDLEICSWNNFDTDGQRPNNNLEGWYGRQKRMVGKQHPNLFEMARSLLDEQSLNEAKMLQYNAGHRVPSLKQKYIDLERRLDTWKFKLAKNDLRVLRQYVVFFKDLSS